MTEVVDATFQHYGFRLVWAYLFESVPYTDGIVASYATVYDVAASG